LGAVPYLGEDLQLHAGFLFLHTFIDGVLNGMTYMHGCSGFWMAECYEWWMSGIYDYSTKYVGFFVVVVVVIVVVVFICIIGSYRGILGQNK
jgi:hypothetical protein